MSERSALAFVTSWMIAWMCSILCVSQAFAAPVGERLVIKPSVARGYKAQYLVTSAGKYESDLYHAARTQRYRDELKLTEKFDFFQPEESETMLDISHTYNREGMPDDEENKGKSGSKGNLFKVLVSRNGQAVDLFSGTYLASLDGIGIQSSFVLLRFGLTYPNEGLAVGDEWESHIPLKLSYAMQGETTLNIDARHKAERRVHDEGKDLLEIKSHIRVVQPEPFSHAMQTTMKLDGKSTPYKSSIAINEFSIESDVTWLVDMKGQVVKAEGKVIGGVSSDNCEQWGDEPERRVKGKVTAEYGFQASRR